MGNEEGVVKLQFSWDTVWKVGSAVISLVVLAVTMDARIDEQRAVNVKQEARIEALDNRTDATERNGIVFNNAIQNINQNVERIDTRQSRMEGVVQEQSSTLREILIQLKNDRRENNGNRR